MSEAIAFTLQHPDAAARRAMLLKLLNHSAGGTVVGREPIVAGQRAGDAGEPLDGADPC